MLHHLHNTDNLHQQHDLLHSSHGLTKCSFSSCAMTAAALSPEVQSALQQLDSGYEVVSHDVQLDYHHFSADAILRVSLRAAGAADSP